MAGRERSRAYPRYSLGELVAAAARIQQELGRGYHDSDSIATALGLAPRSGSALSRIGALGQYGLLDKTREGYALSDRATAVNAPRDEKERADAIREAALAPRIYREIYEKYRPDGKLPGALTNILIRDYGVVAQAANRASHVMRDSLRFADVIDEEGAFTQLESAGGLQPSAVEQPDDATLGSDHPAPAESRHASSQPTHEFRFALPRGRQIVLAVPQDMTDRDIDILEKQLDVLRMLVDTSDNDPTGGATRE